MNEKINLWRRNLAQSQTIRGSDIDELESHLREEIKNLTSLNLSDEEAFLVATHRLGSTDSLTVEYEKLNRSVKFRRWLSLMIAGILTYLLATYFATAISKDCILLAVNSGITGYRSLGFIGFCLQILTLITTIFIGYFILRLILRIPRIRKQIKELTKRMRLLILIFVFLTMTFVYRINFHIPVPGFRPMNIQQHVVQALTYTKFLWSVFLPVILVIVLIIMCKPCSNEIKSQ